MSKNENKKLFSVSNMNKTQSNQRIRRKQFPQIDPSVFHATQYQWHRVVFLLGSAENLDIKTIH